MFLPASNGKPAIFAGSNLDRVVLDFPTNPLVGPRSHEPAMKIERQPLLAAVAIAILYLVLAVACARTLMPWCDEAWFSSPALNLVMHGQMGTPVLDPTAVWNSRDLTLIDRYTYWITPLYPFSESFWMRVFEFSLLTVRLYSVMWGLVALAAWWLVVRKLTANAAAAFLTAALLAVDFTFLWGASVGRMDMMWRRSASAESPRFCAFARRTSRMPFCYPMPRLPPLGWFTPWRSAHGRHWLR